MSSTPSLTPLGAANQELLADLEESFQVALGAAFSGVLDGLGESLFQCADRGLVSQADAAAGVHQVRKQRDSIASRFSQHGTRVWQALAGGRLLSADKLLAESAGGVKLLSPDELETRLAIRSLSGAIAHASRSELSRLQMYVGWISGGLKIDADVNPLGAEHIGVAVHAAFSECLMTAKVRLAVIRACEQALVPAMLAVYTALEAHLLRISQGAHAMPQVRKRRQRHIPTASKPDGTPQGEEKPDWINRFFNRWAAGSAEESVQGAGKHGSEVEVLPSALRQLLRRVRGASVPATPAPEDIHVLSLRELHSVLSLLQTMPGAGFPAIVTRDGPLAAGLKREMLACAARLGLQMDKTRLEPNDEDVVDLVAMLFDILMDENNLTGRRRELIGSLLVPMVKVALNDPRLFLQDSHPVRRLLNLLAEACDGNQGESDQEVALLDRVAQTVERIAGEFDESLTIFLLLEADFAEYFAQYKRKADIAERRVTERQRAQDKREQARAFVVVQLQERTAGHELPPVVRDFVEHAWSQYAQSVVLRGGEQGEAWLEASSLLEGLLAEFDRARQGGSAHGFPEPLTRQLHKTLVGIGTDAQIAGRAIDVLQAASRAVHEARPDETIATMPELPAPPADASDEEAFASVLAGVAGPEYIDNVTAEFFRDLPHGAWLDFVGRDGRVQAGKLAWTSPISSRLMFVSRSGVRFCVASPEELAVMAHLGRLRLHREEDPFYSAMQGVVDSLSACEA